VRERKFAWRRAGAKILLSILAKSITWVPLYLLARGGAAPEVQPRAVTAALPFPAWRG
jgi:hypothetical protein